MAKVIAFLIVNTLTMIRIIGVFCLLPIYHNYGGLAAAILSMLCYFTDFLDGIIARKCKVVSFFGSVFDTIADKAFTVANLLVLLTITKYALIPILFEIAIITIHMIKFRNEINVQSSKVGKIKTWIIALTVIVLYLVTDIEKITFLSQNFIYKINMMDKNLLIGIIFIPVFVFEVLAVISYLLFLKAYNHSHEIEMPNIEVLLTKPKCFKDKLKNFYTIWLDYDFYMKYKDSSGLYNILKQVKYTNNNK